MGSGGNGLAALPSARWVTPTRLGRGPRAARRCREPRRSQPSSPLLTLSCSRGRRLRSAPAGRETGEGAAACAAAVRLPSCRRDASARLLARGNVCPAVAIHRAGLQLCAQERSNVSATHKRLAVVQKGSLICFHLSPFFSCLQRPRDVAFDSGSRCSMKMSKKKKRPFLRYFSLMGVFRGFRITGFKAVFL